MVGYTLIEL